MRWHLTNHNRTGGRPPWRDGRWHAGEGRRGDVSVLSYETPLCCVPQPFWTWQRSLAALASAGRRQRFKHPFAIALACRAVADAQPRSLSSLSSPEQTAERGPRTPAIASSLLTSDVGVWRNRSLVSRVRSRSFLSGGYRRRLSAASHLVTRATISRLSLPRHQDATWAGLPVPTMPLVTQTTRIAVSLFYAPARWRLLSLSSYHYHFFVGTRKAGKQPLRLHSVSGR